MILNQIKGFGIKTFQTYLEEHGTAAEVLKVLMKEDWREEAQNVLDLFDPEKEWKKCEALGGRILGYGEEGYPEPLYQIYDPPLILYVLGELFPGDLSNLAVVGTRHPSVYGKEVTQKLVMELAGSGLTIVSGFARGIDSEAHRAALKAQGHTIAVLGCGIDRIYPPENEKLYEEIRQKGAFISEYPLGAPPLAPHFPKRNRLISGLSLGVLVIEAHEKSGSLITASMALEQGKDVFAVPGRIDSLESRGTHRLIQNGAMLVLNAQDILVELAPALRTCVSKNISTVEPGSEEAPGQDPVLKALNGSPLSMEELSLQTELLPMDLFPRLTALELQRKVEKHMDGRFSLKIQA